jgi:hypothetical protein
VPDPDSGNRQVPVKRRRTRRHRRNILIRRGLAAAVVLVCVAGFSALALQYFSPSLFHARQVQPLTFGPAEVNARESTLNQIHAQARPSRPVYPYSVVPGGIENAKDLKWAAEHDPVVAAHYAGFDYEHAQVVRLTLNRTVYVSYRIGSRIYWTRRRITLHKGETVITDGKITARSRCANRVEETPQQQAVSPVEPPVQKFDEPVGVGSVGTATQAPPVLFQSTLLNRPQAPNLTSTGPLSLYDPNGGGGWVPISPPPLPQGLCAPAKKKELGEVKIGGKTKKTYGPCGPGGGSTGATPEPGTWLLFGSGLALIYWQARRKFSRA